MAGRVIGILTPRRTYSVRHVTCEQFLLERGISVGGHWTMPTAANKPRITIAMVQRAVADHFGIKPEEMTSDRRAREVARPRQVAMYLCTIFTPRSLPEIGRRFGGRDHTTIMHGIRQIEKLRAELPELDNDIKALSVALTRMRGAEPVVLPPPSVPSTRPETAEHPPAKGWCDQCSRLVTDVEATGCRSAWCGRSKLSPDPTYTLGGVSSMDGATG